MTGRELGDRPIDAARLGHIAVGEVLLDRASVDVAPNLRAQHQRLQFRGKQHTAVTQQRVIERLDAQMIARHEQRFALGVPHRKGEHAAQVSHAVLVPMQPGVQQHLGIGMRAKPVAGGLEFLAQRLKVVDLAVEGQPAAARVAGHGLLTAGEIDDRETSVAETDTRFEVITGFVWAAVGQRIGHAAQQARGYLALAKQVDDTRYSAHRVAASESEYA